MEFKGFFTLQTPADLLIKLHRDFERVQESPVHPYPAFDFFITAEHLLDWKYPCRANKSERTALRAATPLLAITSHIASGAKHFRVEDKRHTSVEGHHFAEFGIEFPLSFPISFEPSSLVIELGDCSLDGYDKEISVVELAQLVLEYWDGVFTGGPV